MYRRVLAFVVFGVVGLGAFSASALAVGSAPGWKLQSRAYPTDLAPGGTGFIQVDLFNLGSAASTSPVTVTDVLPAGVVYTGLPPATVGINEPEPWECSGAQVVTCVSTGVIPAEEKALIDLQVHVEGGLPGSFVNSVFASGGGAVNTASHTDAITVSSAPAGFGFVDFEAWASNGDGTIDRQAGSHPYELTVAFDLNSDEREGAGENEENVLPAGSELRNATVNLPPGIIGDPNAVPQCEREDFDRSECPASTQVGFDRAYLGGFDPIGRFPVYNLAPGPGLPAQFGFNLLGIKTFLDAGVRSGGDYGISEHVEGIAQRKIVSNDAVIWGIPADGSHDPDRCTGVAGTTTCGLSSSAGLTPFLTLPTACGAPQPFSVEATGWVSESFTASASTLSVGQDGSPAGFTGCPRLSIRPSMSVAPDTAQSDTPAGLTVDVKVPQEGLLDPEGLSTADIKDTTVTLPEGLVINPGQAAGLGACQPEEDGLGTENAPSCPASSKVGTVSITSPLLADDLQGEVYVLQSNPPNLQLLVAASGDGVNIKLVLAVKLDEATGRLTATVTEVPQFPVTDFKLSFSGGAQAALVTPQGCGTYTASADFTPWSTPFSPDVFASGEFGIASAPAGGSCSGVLPFTPSMTAGSTTDQAGGFSSFSLLLQRSDGQQRISTLRFTAPEGLSGMISRVPLCEEPQAAQGTCSAASQIGHTVTTAGPGPYPLVIPEPGQPPAPIYLTGGYKGQPYGLSIVVPVIAGPFNLGTVVVRASIAVDPHTAQLTVTTDPLPSILAGIPTDLRSIDAVIDRAGFIFNPTNCNPSSFSGVATSPGGTQAAISTPFQVGSCQSLTFKPDLKVTTTGKTSRKNGASLTAKIAYPTTTPGNNQASSQASIASVKVDLPKQLPSRLTTLQKACLAATFDANPASCPKASIVGKATVHTPILPVPLTGPAYFVSHGGEAFPALTIVLQGYGVTVDLVGTTFISKAGITSTTFKQVPDVPFTTFELTLPQGPDSALAANGNLCTTKLKMPTAFNGQNGATIHQTTPITTTNCTKSKNKKAKAKKSKKHTSKH